jgi:hypothetical protein
MTVSTKTLAEIRKLVQLNDDKLIAEGFAKGNTEAEQDYLWMLKTLRDYELRKFQVLDATLLFNGFGQHGSNKGGKIGKSYLTRDAVNTVCRNVMKELDNLVTNYKHTGKRVDKFVCLHRGTYDNWHYHNILFIEPELDLELVKSKYDRALSKCATKAEKHKQDAKKRGEQVYDSRLNYNSNSNIDLVGSRAVLANDNRSAVLYAGKDIRYVKDAWDMKLSHFG